MGRRVLALAYLHDLDVAGRLAAGRLEHLACLFLGHGARRVPRLSLRQVYELGNVPADEDKNSAPVRATPVEAPMSWRKLRRVSIGQYEPSFRNRTSVAR